MCVTLCLVPSFKLFLVLTFLVCLMRHRYDKEAMYFDEGVRNKTKEELLELKALDVWLLTKPFTLVSFYYIKKKCY